MKNIETFPFHVGRKYNVPNFRRPDINHATDNKSSPWVDIEDKTQIAWHYKLFLITGSLLLCSSFEFPECSALEAHSPEVSGFLLYQIPRSVEFDDLEKM